MVLRWWIAAALSTLPLAGEQLSGRVLTDDGLPLPESTDVTLDCERARIGPVRPDLQGVFTISRPPEPARCVLRIAAPGYRRASVATEDMPLDEGIPAAVLFRLGKNDGESISTSHLAAPDEAASLYHAAVRQLQRESRASFGPALALLQEAVQAYPAYAQAWFEIGRLQLAIGDLSQAIKAFGMAIEADPWFVSPYEPLILLLESTGDEAQSLAACEGLRRINPDLPAGCSEH